MKTLTKRNMLVLLLMCIGTYAFSQSYTVNCISDTTTWTNSCDSTVNLEFWADNVWSPSQNVDHTYIINTSGMTSGDQIIVTIDWGDGTTDTYTGIYVSPTSPLFAPGTIPIQHT